MIEKEEKHPRFADTFGERFLGRASTIFIFGTNQVDVKRTVKRTCRNKLFKEEYSETEQPGAAASMLPWAILTGYGKLPQDLSSELVLKTVLKQAVEQTMAADTKIVSMTGYGAIHGVQRILSRLCDVPWPANATEAITQHAAPDNEKMCWVPSKTGSHIIVAIVGNMPAQ